MRCGDTKYKMKKIKTEKKKNKKRNKHAILIDVHPIKNIHRVIESMLSVRTSTFKTVEESTVTKENDTSPLTSLNVCNLQRNNNNNSNNSTHFYAQMRTPSNHMIRHFVKVIKLVHLL